MNPEDLNVSLVTFFPGHEIYELEGHSALRLATPRLDLGVTWGMFDFNAPGFVYRFVKGETDYSVALVDWNTFEREYKLDGRRIVEQNLNLTVGQKRRLLSLIDENLRPENRIYRYNYVKDNCATRPLMMIERSIGDSLCLASPSVIMKRPDLKSFRDFMRYYHSNYPWYQFGIDIALGSGIDYEIDMREMSFAPVVLFDEMSDARIGSPSGEKIVKSVIVLNDEPFDNGIELPTPWYLTPVFVFWVIALILGAGSEMYILKKKRYPRLVASLFFSLLGLTGLLLTFLIFVSVHEATSPNWNYLWLNPIAFIPVVFLWNPRFRKILLWYFIANSIACAAMIFVVLFDVQSLNDAFVPLILLSLSFSAQYLQIYFYEKTPANKNLI